MLAPFILFGITVWIEWRVAVVLLCCVPLIPVSIIAVSKYAKKIFAKYWGKYTSMGDSFLDSVQGLKELKIFKADEACALRIPQQNPDLGYVYDTLLQGRAHELLHIHYPAHGQHS
jgi:ATP-binding cassette subfamily C protein